jgi:polysaccharide biosynthesis protein PelD
LIDINVDSCPPANVRHMRDKTTPLLAKHWRRFVPETLLVLAVLMAIDQLMYAGDQFASLAPHPFWLPVLLAATQYGIAAGMFAATLCSLALYAGGLPAQAAGQDYYDFAALVTTTPALWFAAALLFGGLRAVQVRSTERTEEALYETREQANCIAAGFDRARDEIRQLETRIAGDTATVDGLLRRLSQLAPRDTTSFASTLSGLAADMIGAAQVTLFFDSPSGMQPSPAMDGELAERPSLSAAAVAALLHSRRVVARSQPGADAILPEGVTLIAPIHAPSEAGLIGIIAVGRLRDPTATISRAAARAELVGHAFGALLGDAEMPFPRAANGQNTRRLAIAD